MPGLGKKHTTQFSGIADKPFRDSFRHFETELSAKPKAEALMLLELAAKRLAANSSNSEVETKATELIQSIDEKLMDDEGQPKKVIRTKDSAMDQFGRDFFKLISQAIRDNNIKEASLEAQARLLFDTVALMKMPAFEKAIKGKEELAALIPYHARELAKQVPDDNFDLIGKLGALTRFDFKLDIPKSAREFTREPKIEIEKTIEQDFKDTLTSIFMQIRELKDKDSAVPDIEFKRYYGTELSDSKDAFLKAVAGTDKQKIKLTEKNFKLGIQLFQANLKDHFDQDGAAKLIKSLDQLAFDVQMIAAQEPSKAERFLLARSIESKMSEMKNIRDSRLKVIANDYANMLKPHLLALYNKPELVSNKQRKEIQDLFEKVDIILGVDKDLLKAQNPSE